MSYDFKRQRHIAYLIIIPAYNEEEHIANVLRDIRASDFSADILVVNDGSTDGT